MYFTLHFCCEKPCASNIFIVTKNSYFENKYYT